MTAKKPLYGGKDVVLSLQHMFAMLGATITVPMVVGMSIPLALISAGAGTILFYFLTKRQVPVFLGSSFAFMPGLITVFGFYKNGNNNYAPGTSQYNAMALAAMLALVCAGLVYVIFSFVIKAVGVQKVKKLFPPIVIGPVIIVIGMNLAGSIFWNDIIAKYAMESNTADAWKNWLTAIVTALTIIGVNTFAKPKSFLKVIPILIGFAAGYICGLCCGLVKFNFSGDIVVFQQAQQLWGFYGAWKDLDGALVATAMVSLVPIAVVTFMEHLGDISANSTVCGKDFMVTPGLHRTVLGDGVATAVSGLLGGPANTTYGENTAVLAITKNYDPKNIFLAACISVGLGLFVPFGEVLSSMPAAVVGGACVVLFGMIAASGLRALVDARVDFGNTKNLIVVAVTLSVGLGLGACSLAGSVVGQMSNYTVDGNLLKVGFPTKGGGFVEISPLAICTVLAIVLNLIIPDSKRETLEQEKAQLNTNVSLTSGITDAIEAADGGAQAKQTDASNAEEGKSHGTI